MSKKFYVLYSLLTKFQPKIYQSKTTINKYLRQNSSLTFQFFNTEKEAIKFRNKKINLMNLPIQKLNQNTGNTQPVEVNNKISGNHIQNLTKKVIETYSEFKVIQESRKQQLLNVVHQQNKDQKIILTQNEKLQQIKTNNSLQQNQSESSKIQKDLLYQYEKSEILKDIDFQYPVQLYCKSILRQNPGVCIVGYKLFQNDSELLTNKLNLGRRYKLQSQILVIIYGLWDSYINNIRKINVHIQNKYIQEIITQKKNTIDAKLFYFKQILKSIEPCFQKIEYITHQNDFNQIFRNIETQKTNILTDTVLQL